MAKKVATNAPKVFTGTIDFISQLNDVGYIRPDAPAAIEALSKKKFKMAGLYNASYFANLVGQKGSRVLAYKVADYVGPTPKKGDTVTFQLAHEQYEALLIAKAVNVAPV